MINEKISLRTWIEAAADQGVPLHTYLLKLSSEELELSEDAILVVEEGKKFLNKGVVAIDLAGPEEEGFVKKYKKAIVCYNRPQ